MTKAIFNELRLNTIRMLAATKHTQFLGLLLKIEGCSMCVSRFSSIELWLLCCQGSMQRLSAACSYDAFAWS